jgi:hypothetical protein
VGRFHLVHSGKRKTSPTPNKKVRVNQLLLTLTPSFNLLFISDLLCSLNFQSSTLSPIPVDTLLQAARYQVGRLILRSFISPLDPKIKIRSLLDTRGNAKILHDRSNSIVKTLSVQSSVDGSCPVQGSHWYGRWQHSLA